MSKNQFYVYSFYRFLKIENKYKIKKLLDNFFLNKKLKGTILLANEGINGSIATSLDDFNLIFRYIKKILKIRKIEIKINETDEFPFNKIKVRVKKEIVSLGIGKINIQKYRGDYIEPSKWGPIIRDKKTHVIDVRNYFEIDIGSFYRSKNPLTKSFRDFPKKIEKMEIPKNERIAMYCTGGIRCEKASSYLKINGYKNVVQLSGGILNYLKYIKETGKKSDWHGECFVFDKRVTLNKQLKKGKYTQCYGCRRPITKKDTMSKLFKKGVCCPYCYYERSSIQKNNSLMRQKQIDEALSSKE